MLELVKGLRVTRFVYGYTQKVLMWLVIVVCQIRISFALRRLRRDKKNRVSVAFLIVYDMIFQFEQLFRLMLKDELFDPHIIIVPDVHRGRENMLQSLDSSYNALVEKYPGHVSLSIDENGEFVDYKDLYQIFFLMNPYAGMTHKFYTFEYLARNGRPCCYANYAVGEGTKNCETFNRMTELSFLWRFYLERPMEVERIGTYHPALTFFKRVCVVGPVKCDALGTISCRWRSKPCIIIAPHHSVPGNDTPLSMGNFHKYADLFLKLPEIYPNIDWVFRPHPLLFLTMVDAGYWTVKEKEMYIKKMCAYSNVEYQSSGDYYDAFVNSDAMIQDSGSFLAEYHITKHPQCYLLSSPKSEYEQFNDFGRNMLSHTYKAYSEDDIHGFIRNVVLGGKDEKKGKRSAFVDNELMYNFPNSSRSVLEDIKEALGRSK